MATIPPGRSRVFYCLSNRLFQGVPGHSSALYATLVANHLLVTTHSIVYFCSHGGVEKQPLDKAQMTPVMVVCIKSSRNIFIPLIQVRAQWFRRADYFIPRIFEELANIQNEGARLRRALLNLLKLPSILIYPSVLVIISYVETAR